MNRYYAVTFFVWAGFSVVSLALSLWKYRELGNGAFWYFVASGLSLLLCGLRYRAWQKIRRAEKKPAPGNKN